MSEFREDHTGIVIFGEERTNRVRDEGRIDGRIDAFSARVGDEKHRVVAVE